jgi:REP element-mobilizing transposase RayT
MVPLPEWADLPQRKSPRHPSHDYTSGGAYHVVVCIENMRSMLGRVVNSQMELNWIGKLVLTEIQMLPKTDAAAYWLDVYSIMPDHVHQIIFLNGLYAQRPSLSAVVGQLKSRIAGQYSKVRTGNHWNHLPERLLQRSYYDRYLRTEAELAAARTYILNNPRALELKRQGILP